jgi:pimeloyl-ACP methyl ester carboxylesterase
MMHVETLGTGPRVVLVHGSVANGAATWQGQRSLAERFELVVPDRPGFPPNPPVDRVDFEEQAPPIAELLGDGAHLVGHSYGGVIALFAAGLRPEAVRSLAVLEPPAFGVARGNPAADAFVEGGRRLWSSGPREPRAFLAEFLRAVGSTRELEDPLPPDLEQGASALMVERGPWEAEPPLDLLRAAPFPKLVVSGGHSAAFDAVCDVLERELRAERRVCAGAAHTIPRAPGFTELLADWLDRAERANGRT